MKKDDDVKKKDVEQPDGEDIEEAVSLSSFSPKGEKESFKEWKEIKDLAQEVFRVYFTIDDDSATTNMKSFSKIGRKMEKGLLTKINGTMPTLPSYLTNLHLPKSIVSVLLFIEASFRGIAQVRSFLVYHQLLKILHTFESIVLYIVLPHFLTSHSRCTSKTIH